MDQAKRQNSISATTSPRSEITPQRVLREPAARAAGGGRAGARQSDRRERRGAARRIRRRIRRRRSSRRRPTRSSSRSTRSRRYKDITTYNNFYEFGTDKADPAHNAGTLRPHPWKVSVEGEIKNPKVYDIDELLKLAPLEERVYRLRCVEGWSMVIPWIGIPLAELIKRVEPTGNAKYVQFITLADPTQMPGRRRRVLDWPYPKACAWTKR